LPIGQEFLLSLSSHDDIAFEHPRTGRSRAAVHGAFWSTLTSLIPGVLTGLVFVVTSRYLSLREFGVASLALSIVNFVSAIAPIEFGQAIIQQKTIRQSHLDTVFWVTFGSALVLYGALWAASSMIGRKIGESLLAPLLLVIGIKLFFDLMAVVPNALVGRTMAFHLITMRTLFSTAVSGVICVALIVSGSGIWALAISQVVASAASCIAAFWAARWIPGLRIKSDSFRELAHYGVFASANRLLQTINLDQLIIGTMLSPVALAIYNFARRLFQMLNDVVAGGLTSVVHALFSSMQEQPEKVREAFLMATFGCALVSFPAFMGLAAVSGDAIPLIFGQKWTPAIWPVRFFCVIGLMSGIGVIQAALINSQGKSDWWFYYQLVRNVITIASIFVLRNRGIDVIVMAIMIQVLILWPVSLYMVSRLIDSSIREYFYQFLRPTVAYIGLLIAALTTAGVLHSSPAIWRLLAQIVAGAVIYCGLIFVLCRDQVAILLRVFLRTGKTV
jgi:O-antigen/teichoic acid export membrane protein